MMRFTRILITMVAVVTLAACSSDNSKNTSNDANTPTPGTSMFLASGGTSTSGMGGTGGYVSIQSYGAAKVLKSGTVDAIVTVPTFTPDFGPDPTAHAVVSAGTTTTVVVDTDDFSGQLCMATSLGSPYLYTGDGNGTCGDTNDILVTGLTVESGAILVLADYGYWGGYGELWLDNDLVVNGTIRTDAPNGLYIEAKTIDVESSGKIVTSATTTDANAGELYLGYGNGMTKQIINHGMIEAKGLGNGSGGYMYFEPDDLVANTGTIDASGGDSTVADSSGGAGGSSGALDVFVDYGDFYSSGTVRVNGGRGATDGGDNEADLCNISYYCSSVYIETTYADNTRGRNGDIVISGTWVANGGEGVDGRGGYGGYIYLQTNALGEVTINANMSVRGGDSTGAGSFSGSYTYGIDIYSYFDPYGSGGFNDPATPGSIRIAGQYELRGGNGDESGGSGGYLRIYGSGYNSANKGPDVELVGFPSLIMNGGDGANGGSASGIQLYTYSPGGMPAGPITNEANIEARGGNAAATSGSYGGSGGTVTMTTNGISDPSETITNAGYMDISGGTGDTGGAGSMINLGAQHVTNSGNLTANGGNGVTGGTIGGGSGGNINLNSYDVTTLTTNTGTLSVRGGTPDGSPGTVNIDMGGPL